MNLDTAIAFWQRCIDENAQTEQERIAIMQKMIHEHDIKILTEKRLYDTIKGKKVLHIKKEDKKDE